MEVRRFEYSPLVEIRRWSEITASQPLFEAILVFENYLTKGTDETRRFDSLQRTHFPLTLVVWPGREIRLKAGFYTGRFEPAAIEWLLEHIEALLRAFVAARPGARLADLPAHGPAEAATLATWHRPRAAAAAGPCLHERFAAQAARRPDAVVVNGANGITLTYRELDERANQLAWLLRRLGVGPEVPVGLCTGRSPDLIVGLLGILKAGGAYVPLDPLYPSERLAFLAEDAGVRIVVTEDHLAAALPDGAAGSVLVRLDGDAAALAREPRTAPESGALPESLAYVIYTSGSTGRPKGSLISHANVAGLLDATAEGFCFAETDVWTLFHSYAFDFSIWEIWGALAFGGRLNVVPHEVSRSPDAFRELLARERVTVLNQTPSAFRQLVEADARWVGAGGLALRLVIFGGEALDPAALAPWFDRHGDELPRLVNMYGITETTVHVTWRSLSREDAARGGSPIGVPVPDLWAAVLDAGLAPAPVGVPGELCVGGAGLARGYLGRPDLTAERFVPDPLGKEHGEPGSRLYRSGDLARRRGDGELEYLGRLDHQVKIRGFRIEPGEIEAELERHPGVRRAVVLPEGQGEDRRLLAYVVATNGAPPGPAELREHLRPRLPDYMIPAGWVFVSDLPLTAHGKADLAALRRAGGASLAVAPYEAPQSALEQAIAALWQDLLGVERVGVHDNFFDLGGHSILMIQVQRRLQDQLGRKLSMVDLLSHASVGSLARFLSGGGTEDEAELAEVTERRAEEGKSRLRQMRRAGRPNGEEAP
jgi:amino acid adenylation domain-containing protein